MGGRAAVGSAERGREGGRECALFRWRWRSFARNTTHGSRTSHYDAPHLLPLYVFQSLTPIFNRLLVESELPIHLFPLHLVEL